MSILRSLLVFGSLVAACQTPLPPAKPQASQTTPNYPQPFDPEFTRAQDKSDTQPTIVRTRYDRESAQESIFAPEHKDLFAEPITAPLMQRFPHLRAHSGQLLLGSESLQFVVAGVTTTQQAKGLLPLILATYARHGHSWQLSPTAGRIDWKLGRSKDALWPIIGIDADHGPGYAALSLVAAPSIRSPLRLKTSLVFLPNSQTLHVQTQPETKETNFQDVSITLRQHGFSGQNTYTTTAIGFTANRMLNDDVTVLQAFSKQVQSQSEDLFIGSDKADPARSFQWSLSWGTEFLKTGLVTTAETKSCQSEALSAFFTSAADHSKLVSALKKCTEGNASTMTKVESENEDYSFPIPRLLHITYTGAPIPVALDIPYLPGQDLVIAHGANESVTLTDPATASEFADLSSEPIKLRKRLGGAINLKPDATYSYIQLHPSDAGQALDVGRALQNFLSPALTQPAGANLYLMSNLQFSLPYGTYAGQLFARQQQLDCPISFSLDSENSKRDLECSSAASTGTAESTMVHTLDLSSKDLTPADQIKFLSHGVQHFTTNIGLDVPAEPSPTSFFAISESDPFTQLSLRLFPLTPDQIKTWNHQRGAQHGNALTKLAAFQKSIPNPTWLVMSCPSYYLDPQTLGHWLQQLKPQGLEVTGCGSAAFEKVLTQAALHYLASSEQTLYLLPRSGIADRSAFEATTPFFVYVFGKDPDTPTQVWTELAASHFYIARSPTWRTWKSTLTNVSKQTEELTMTVTRPKKEATPDRLSFTFVSDAGSYEGKVQASAIDELTVTFTVPKSVRFGQVQWAESKSTLTAMASLGADSLPQASSTLSGRFATLDLDTFRSGKETPQ